MRELMIIDAVAHRALMTVADDIAADMNEAEAGLNAIVPKHLLQGMEAAAVALCDQTYLDIIDHFSTGQIGDEFDVFGHHDRVMVSFANRMTTSLRLMSFVSLPWVADCQKAIAYTYVERFRELSTMSRQGGFA